MTTPADLVRDNAALLAGYHPRLEYALTQASSGDGGMAPRPADAPFPGDPAAFATLMVIWEAVPRLEASIRLAIAGRPGSRRGGSAANFLEALEAVVSLSGGLDEDGEALAARVLERLAGLARRVRAIDEAEQWRYVQARACPRCGCYALKVLLGEDLRPGGRIECFGHTRNPGRRAGRRGPASPISSRSWPGRTSWPGPSRTRTGERRWRPGPGPRRLDPGHGGRAVRRGGRPR